MSLEKLKGIAEAAETGLPGFQSAKLAFGELTINVARDSLVETFTALRDGAAFKFQQLIDVTAADYPARPERFDVVYHLLSMTQNLRIRIKTTTDEVAPVPTIRSVYPGADWYERETFDMFGIIFSGHPDLRRLLTDYGFDGHPLRKDFPMTGYVEVRWDEELRRVVYEQVKLTQEFRKFDFQSPWEGAQAVLPGDEKAGA